jgi:hypothetical protein
MSRAIPRRTQAAGAVSARTGTNPAKRKPRDLEHQEQKALIQWCELAAATYPELRYLHAVPNGGDRHPAVAAKLRAEGCRKGVPDIFLDVPRHGFHGLRIELKRPGDKAQGVKRGEVKPEQADWLAFLAEQGYLAVVCWGWESARDTLQTYLTPKTEQE